MVAALSLSIDDCLESDTKSFLEILNEVQLKASFFAITDFVGNRVSGHNYADWDRLASLGREGHEIGSHSCTHISFHVSAFSKAGHLAKLIAEKGVKSSFDRLSYLSKKNSKPIEGRRYDAFEQIVESKKEIEERLGVPCVSFSYPGGWYNRKVQEVIRDVGYSSARSSSNGLNGWHDDFFRLKSFVWDRNTKVESVNKIVDKAIEDGSWMIETFHSFDSSKEFYSASKKDVLTHLKYVRSKFHFILVAPIGSIIDRSKKTVLF